MRECPICHDSYKDVYRHVLTLVPRDDSHAEWVKAKGISLVDVAIYKPSALRQLKEALDRVPMN